MSYNSVSFANRVVERFFRLNSKCRKRMSSITFINCNYAFKVLAFCQSQPLV